MKNKFISIAFILLAFVAATAAQNRIKLFDAQPISISDPNVIANQYPYGKYRSAEVYLSCPTGPALNATLTGPNGGGLIADNLLTLNYVDICDGNCFSSISTDPMALAGMSVEAAYNPVAPIDISRAVRGGGPMTFNILDFGYTYGNSEIYLNTSCTIIPVSTGSTDVATTICHRDNGSRGGSTLSVSQNAIASHLAHGDTVGACSR